jgi:hypothetical protein
MLATVRL